ncbi:MAG: 5-formyltetrahydrofolate cyclo-ligase [Campylobacteraceae bacterium]
MRLKRDKSEKNIYTSKDEFRNISRAKLQKIAKTKRLKNSKMVVEKLSKLFLKFKPKNVLLYFPLLLEVDILPLVKKLRKDINIFVPFMEGTSFKLVKYRLPVSKKQFNIMEPENSFQRLPKIDVAVVPVIGVDGMMKRVGFGRGMYDRFFDSLSPKPLIVFVQLTKCFTSQKLCEPFDIQGDFYITPNEIIQRGLYGSRDSNRHNSCRTYRDFRVFSCKKIRFSKSRNIYNTSKGKSKSD